MKRKLLTAASCLLLIGISQIAMGQSWDRGGNSGAGATTLGFTDAQNLNIITNNTTKMTVTSSGNVGIGTASPGFLLHVRSTTGNASMQFESTTGSANINVTRGGLTFGSGVTYKTGSTSQWQTGLLANNNNYPIRNNVCCLSFISSHCK